MSASRRAILKMIGSSAAAAPTLAASLHAGIAKAGIIGIGASPIAAVAQALPTPITSTSLAVLGKPFYHYLEGLRNKYADECYARQAMRISGVDADIAALKSVSAVTRARMQRQRDAEDVDLRYRLQNVLWPSP